MVKTLGKVENGKNTCYERMKMEEKWKMGRMCVKWMGKRAGKVENGKNITGVTKT